MKVQIKTFFIFGLALLLAANPFRASDLFASGHGCATHEPDRDGDGVPDKDDAFPDDPSQAKEEVTPGSQERVCGTRSIFMKVYFVPFNAQTPTPVTKDNIEKTRVNALLFCSKNDMVDTIQNILNQNNGSSGETVSAEAPQAVTAPSEAPALTAKDDEDLDKLFKEKEGSTTDSIEKEVGEESEFSLGSVDGNQIRLKVEIPQSESQEITYLVDKTGQGIKNGKPFKLSSDQMGAIEKMVQSVSGIVDLTLKSDVLTGGSDSSPNKPAAATI